VGWFKPANDRQAEIQSNVTRHAMRDMDGPAPEEPTTWQGIKTFLPGLDWQKFKKEILDELKFKLEQGAHEIGSMLFTGNSYVQYPRAGKENMDKPNVQQPEQGRERSIER
jgi:hypothetical protein